MKSGMGKKLPISVVMIARNEERRLPQSLGSVADWVGEIIVVINDCTDNTKAVAQSYGATVSEHPFRNLRDQKSVALGKATQPWVLSLDADEVVSPELKEEIFRFFVKRSANVDGVWFSRRLWFMNRWMRHGDTYPDRVLRLFRNGKGRLAGTEEHDRFEVEGTTIRFKHDLLHYSHESVASHVDKINFFSDFFLQRATSQNKRVGVLTAIVRGYWRFVRAYFLRLGFLDGFPGFYMAYFAAFATFIKYTRLYEYNLMLVPEKESMEEDEIAVVIAPDEAYVVHAGVAIKSILRHTEQPQRFHFYVLLDEAGVDQESLEKLRQIVTEDNASLDTLKVDQKQLAGLEGGFAANYLPPNAFYKMLIPELFPQLERCIYVDCDLVALDDLALMWREDISQVAIGAVTDWHVEGRGLRKYPQIQHYFNSGVLYMNLKRCRERNYINECFRLAAIPEVTKRYSDQDVLNLAFCEDMKLLHPRWNIQTGQDLLCKLHGIKHGDPSWKQVLKRPGIAHFSGRLRKPWSFDMKHRHAMEYWENFCCTPWGKIRHDAEELMTKARRRNRWARFRDLMRQFLMVKITPKRGVYRLVFLGITCVNIMPDHKKV